jgi:hypothetical protein
MKTSSAKAKGRKLQQEVRDALRKAGVEHGLVDGDIESRGMGQNGVDVILSPAAQKVFDLYIECKQVEKLNVVSTFYEHFNKYADKPGLKLLVHGRNRTESMITLKFIDFMELLTKSESQQ